VRDTSRKAYQQILYNGLLSQARMNVYHWLYHHGPATGSQVEKQLGYRHANKRLPELRDRGVVREVYTRPCPVTGKDAIWWDVTSKLPVEPKRYHEYRVLLRVRPKHDPWETPKQLHRCLRHEVSGIATCVTVTVVRRVVRCAVDPQL
jgi:hypothetical protein